MGEPISEPLGIVKLSPDQQENFKTERYAKLNATRWDHFLSIGIPLEGKSIFEPGAGIGDQTKWLLSQGAAHIWVQDGRECNADIICQRFAFDPRVTVLPDADLEVAELSDLPFVDLIFCYGVYYHLNDPPPFRLLREFSKIGEIIVMDYLAGQDAEVDYGYENPSTSLSQKAYRPRPETLLQALNDIWICAYEPRKQLEWQDPLAAEQRLIAIGSHLPLDNPNLIKFAPSLTPQAV